MSKTLLFFPHILCRNVPIMKKFLIIILFFTSVCFSQNLKKISLSDNWLFKEQGNDEWFSATVPGTVHTDLLNNKLIDDPFFGDNEKKLQWIGEKDWVYLTTFSSNDFFNYNKVEIVFEGLDTYAKVYLNDTLIIDANNMFRTWQKDCKSFMKKEKNILKVVFSSAVKVTDSIRAKANYKLPGEEYSYVRKAAYHFGWDFGPKFVTAGIWRPVYILAWNDVKIEDVSFQQEKVTEEEASIHVPYFLNCVTKDLFTISIKDTAGLITYAEKTDSLYEGLNLDAFDFNLYNPHRWWTKDLGAPYLYSFKFEVKRNEIIIDKKIFNIGIRKIELVQNKDSYGESFYFKLNDVPVFIRGANYIPQDMFLPRITNVKYEKITNICDHFNSYINMLRVWGGGVYEDEEFYNQCDKKGILVWQDFMFACAMYPGDSVFLENVKIEASQNVSRLKNHPCIALWCGNNEIDEGWKNWGWQKEYSYSKEDSMKIWNDYEKLFKNILPEVVQSISPDINYISTSPKIGWGHPESMKEGDSHYWGVWWGMEPFEMYKKKVPRFMSEYGFQGMPDMKTIESFTSPEGRNLNSSEFKNHEKHPKGFETIEKSLLEEYNEPRSFEEYVYLSQLTQAYGVKTAIEAHRRAKPHCMGTMYWQLNDCWPGISWSGIDYYGRWKAAQYFINDAYSVFLTSPVVENDSIKVYVVSDRPQEYKFTLQILLKDFSGNILKQIDTLIRVPENSSNLFLQISEEEFLKGFNKNEVFLETNLIIFEMIGFKNILYFGKTKELNLLPASVKIDVEKSMTYGEASFIRLNIEADKLVKNLYLFSDDKDVKFSPNYFDVIPGERNIVICETKLSKEDFEKKLKYYYSK